MGDLDLARRAVAAKGWRWLEGANGCGFAEVVGDSVYACDGYQSCPLCEPENYREMLPDLDDAATLGCIEALVREAWGEDAHIKPMFGGGWVVDSRAIAISGLEHPHGPTRVEAMIDALEAAKETK